MKSYQARRQECHSTVLRCFCSRGAAGEYVAGPRGNALLFTEVTSWTYDTGGDVWTVESAPIEGQRGGCSEGNHEARNLGSGISLGNQ